MGTPLLVTLICGDEAYLKVALVDMKTYWVMLNQDCCLALEGLSEALQRLYSAIGY
jgi:hypothetical protein